MAHQESEAGMRLTLISGLVIVGFMAFGLAISVYRMAVFDSSVASIERQNDGIRDRINQKEQELAYYRSTQFKDKFAKENLQLVAEGEHMLIIEPTQQTNSLQEDAPTNDTSSLLEQQLRQIPVYQHWQLYLFRPDALEEIQNSLE